MDRIELGRHSYACNPIFRGAMSKVKVGSFTSIAEGVVFDCGFQHDYKCVTSFPLHTINWDIKSNVFSKGDIKIGNDVWIGEGAMIMSGVTIGNGCIIGAREIVRHRMLPYQILKDGEISLRFTIGQIIDLTTIKWWDWPDEKIIENSESLLSYSIDKFIKKHINYND